MFWVLISASCTVLLWGLALALLVPSLVLIVESVAAMVVATRPSPALIARGEINAESSRLVVLVPAHNESENIRATLEALLPQMRDCDRILVIADNCTDNTAGVAQDMGVTVLERYNPQSPGKGYALDFALQELQRDPPDLFMVLDADCLVSEHTIAALVAQACQTQGPVQATYLMTVPADASLVDRISTFAMKVRNLVRLSGITALGFPSILAGSGMIFPWHVLERVSFAGDKCVDDMQLTIDLAIAGYPATYTTAGRVVGRLMQKQAARSQRSRWEHGHLEVILTQIPKLIQAAWQQRRVDLGVMALDLSVPPLSLLVLLWVAVFGLATLAALGGLVPSLPAIITGGEASLVGLVLILVWLQMGQEDLPFKTALAIPVYLLWKLPIYVQFFRQPQTRWLKTERDPESVAPRSLPKTREIKPE
ncbi:MAG: glycosyltransferase family 2 protein [Acaryochloridaceae cyanobacterium SU_2_1]|nr:glycosyltransferase family 2 protein [Acaryochloridaceae cyanobacterium SU_2_1]